MNPVSFSPPNVRFGRLYEFSGAPADRERAVTLLKQRAAEKGVELETLSSPASGCVYVGTGPIDAAMLRPLRNLDADTARFREELRIFREKQQQAKEAQLTAKLRELTEKILIPASQEGEDQIERLAEAAQTFTDALNRENERIEQAFRKAEADYFTEFSPNQPLKRVFELMGYMNRPVSESLRSADEIARLLEQDKYDVEKGERVYFPKLPPVVNRVVRHFWAV